MSKHRKTATPSNLDLKRNPGIGQSSSGIDQKEIIFEDVEGDSTTEGDVLNETKPSGGIDPRHRGRTNK